MPFLWRLVRKLLGPGATLLVGVVSAITGVPPDLTAIAAASAGQLVGAFLPIERSREEVVADVANRERRADAYEQFGASVAVAWQSAGHLMTFHPKVVGYLHGLALLVRAQRRFEDESAAATAALSNVLLYGSTETQQAGLDVFTIMGEKLREVGRYKQGSPEVARVYELASLDLGDKVVTWRKAAQADLGYVEAWEQRGGLPLEQVRQPGTK